MKISKKEQEKIEQILYITGASLGGLALILYCLYRIFPLPVEKFLIPCMFHRFTGLYCPGCGGTRAVEMLLRGKWLVSFFYHPIVPYGAAIYLYFMISHTIQKLSHNIIKSGMRYRNAYLWIALALTVLNVLVKNGMLILYCQDIPEMLNRYL